MVHMSKRLSGGLKVERSEPSITKRKKMAQTYLDGNAYMCPGCKRYIPIYQCGDKRFFLPHPGTTGKDCIYSCQGMLLHQLKVSRKLTLQEYARLQQLLGL
jgi:hypothetical protein